MDCKIIFRLFFLIVFFTSTHLNAIEFKGKFLQGHYIVGITDPSAKIIIDKKEIKVWRKLFRSPPNNDKLIFSYRHEAKHKRNRDTLNVSI